MSEPIISVSGLRGVIGDSLTPELAIRFAAAFSEVTPPGDMLISRDGRTTGRMLSAAIRAGLEAVGRNCIDADVAATPTTGVLVRSLKCAGGVQISASHNPPEYNGIKLFSAAGRVIPAAAGQQVIDRYRGSSPAWRPHDRIGRTRVEPDTISAHWDLIRQTVNVERIRGRKFTVLLDANHGAGSVLGRRLLEELSCQVEIVGGQPDGRFEHPPEPLAENLKSVLSLVTRLQADVGFCQDPDADRLAVIDERGRYLGEELTLALCVDHVLRATPGPIVTNCSTSRMSEDLASRYGVPFFRSAVGEANVVDEMLSRGAVLGGEGNGGVIDPRVGLVRDSFVGMALLLDAMAARELRVSQLAAELPHYEIVKTKVTLPREKIAPAFESLVRHFPGAAVDRMDGLRLDWPGKWLLVRSSNTEPVVRAIAEAQSVAEAKALCDAAAAAFAKV